jgi:hypothetical protein
MVTEKEGDSNLPCGVLMITRVNIIDEMIIARLNF